MLTVRRTRHDPGTFLAACVFIVPWTTALCGQTSQHQPTHGVIAEAKGGGTDTGRRESARAAHTGSCTCRYATACLTG